MIKKLTILFCLLISALGLNAQLPVGAWTIHSAFNGVSDIAETTSTVYYLSAGSLFSVDKATGETRSLNSANDLNGGAISGIYAHPEGKYLIVAYADCNIDRINADGSVINISDISDALIPGNPSINWVGFGNDRIYVAGSYGLTTFDAKTNQARETMFTPMGVTRVFGLGDEVVIVYDRQFRHAKQDTRLISLDQFSYFSSQERTNVDKPLTVGDNRVLYVSGNYGRVAQFDFTTGELKIALITDGGSNVSGINKIVSVGPDKAFVANGSKAYILTPDNSIYTGTSTALSSTLANQTALSATFGLDHLWAGNAAGINSYNATDLANPIELTGKFGKGDFTAAGCNRIAVQKDGSLLFWNEYYEFINFDGFTNIAGSNLNASAYSRTNGFSPVTVSPFQINGANRSNVNMPGHMTKDPRDPNTWYVGSRLDGLMRFTNDKLTMQLNCKTAPFGSNNGTNTVVTQPLFDKYDNLWVIKQSDESKSQLFAIPYDKIGEDATEWTTFPVLSDSYLNRTVKGIELQHSDMIAIYGGFWRATLTMINHNGTASPSDDKVFTINTFIDQDSKTFSYYHTTSVCEDKKGRLWVGTDVGVFEITDPSKATADVTTINHLKVPRNNGTGLADYLLDAQFVTGISCDNSNRKWISTTTSGVYLVSEDGDEILEHYTTDNSILPSNKVLDVACDPNSSSVFFATEQGVIEYNSTSAPASEDLSDVYAYPNPVRPDYTGWITVTGLMDNTLVKIADAAGNVFFQGRSEGGMLTWDGCDANGDRVRTGVYFVFASHGASGESSDNCVTKIMVIN